MMKDKNNKIIKAGDICLTHDRFGDVWVAPICYEYINWVKGKKKELIFDSNYKTVVHDYWSNELEIIGNKKDNPWLLSIHCNPIVYATKRIIWNIKMNKNKKQLKNNKRLIVAWSGTAKQLLKILKLKK